MSRRMIDPQMIIKSQIVNDKEEVDLYELLEKYGTETENSKSITLQIYSKEVSDDNSMQIWIDNGDIKGLVMVNTAITISKDTDNANVFIRGVLFNMSFTNFIEYIQISDGDYENGIILYDNYPFDVHVIKV